MIYSHGAQLSHSQRPYSNYTEITFFFPFVFSWKLLLTENHDKGKKLKHVWVLG